MSFDDVVRRDERLTVDDSLNFSRVTLEKFMLYILQTLDKTELSVCDLKVYAERSAYAVSLQYQFMVWGESQREIVIKSSCPTTWWQHFKRDVLKCKKIKVHEEITTIDPKILYPHMKISLPDEKHVLHLVRRTSTTELWRKV